MPCSSVGRATDFDSAGRTFKSFHGSQRTNMSKPFRVVKQDVVGYEDSFPSGKYCGCAVKYIVASDFQYILWANAHSIFKFDPKVLKAAKQYESQAFVEEYIQNYPDVLEDVPY